MKKPSVLIIFLTVFIDLIGFGIVLPLLPIYSKSFGAAGWQIGLLMASYSVMQFIFAPVWGRLSDRIGRRPVLLVSTAGAAVSYSVFALGSGLTGQLALVVLLVSRMFAGICGANITVAQAYIADITPLEERSKRMGLIGMAFGLGFILGPALSSMSLSGFTLPLVHLRFNGFGLQGPGWVAACLCAANFLFAFSNLPESWRPNSEQVKPRPRLGQWVHTLSQPKVGLLIGLFFLATFCFTCFETTLGLLVSENFHLDLQSKHDMKCVGYLFAYCGVIGALVQGGAIGRAVKKLGEPLLISVSLLLVAISMALLPLVHGNQPFAWRGILHPEGAPWLELLFVLALLSIGSSLTRPPVFGLISILTPAHEQGETIGVAQGAGSLARIVGPLFAATLFDRHPALPYLICATLALLTGILAWQFLHKPTQTVVEANTQGAG
ncbi:MAG TPA: MFS transporter [Haliangiales bacterium]|nr:MFS transporter [Haliangiales bacterium]